MRRWWKWVGVCASGLASLGGFLASANAQFPPPNGGGFGMPPGMGMGGPPPGMMGGMPPMAGMSPGAFNGNPNFGGMPADFPNPPQPSKEPVSPFTIPNDGIPGAFTDCIDPRPRRPEPYTILLRAEYLGWWLSKGGSAVDLATSTGNFPNEIGALNQPNTTILVPKGDIIDYQMVRGYRAAAGLAIGYLPPVEVSGFSLNRNLTVFNGGSTDASGIFIARPVQVTNVQNGPNAGLETSEVVNIPGGILNGTLDITSRMSFWGVDVNALFCFIETDCFKVDLLLGYRHVDLYESLEINNKSGGFAGQVTFGGVVQPNGFSVNVQDIFRTRNAFDGGQFGFRTIFSIDRLSLFSDVKLAMGNTRHLLTIDGNTTLYQNAPNRAPTTLPGGLLALPSNSGTTSRNEFSIVPEANLSISYQLGQHIRIFGGYNILYWSSVARPGDHMNSVIDARGVPSSIIFAPGAGTQPTTPAIQFRDFFAHGVFGGIEFGF